MKLYEYQKDSVKALLGGKHICIAGTGVGKGSIALHWAKCTGKPNILVCTTASKRDSHDFEKEADAWFPEWRNSLSSFSVISWQGLDKWRKSHSVAEIKNTAFIFDEVACCKAGVGSLRGKAFLYITSQTQCWTGYTATPGDKWIDYYAYFTAANKVRNKTQFVKNFCQVQTFKGFPEIVGYNNTHILKGWWKEIADLVDSSEVDKQLPRENHKVVNFKTPKGYKQVLKTRQRLDNGEMLETSGGMCAYLRQLCLTPEKETWIKDFTENLGTNAVFFYNFIDEGNRVEELLKKALPKEAKIWRIDGKTHDIPTAETIGKYDVVLTQWQAGSMGLNLQFIQYWVSVSPCYSWSISEQGRGRIKRIGQTKPMFFYYIFCCDTIEEDIYKCLKKKKDFIEDLWDKERQNNK